MGVVDYRRGKRIQKGTPSTKVQAGDQLRFLYRYHSNAPMYLLLFMSDAKANIIPLYPAKAGASFVLPAGHFEHLRPLPDGAVLDDANTPKRIYGCVSRRRLSYKEARRALQSSLLAPPFEKSGVLSLHCVYQQSIFLFYFSGHAKEHHFQLGREGLSFAEVRRFARRLPARIQVMLLDSCYSGGFLRAKGVRRLKSIGWNPIAQLRTRSVAIGCSRVRVPVPLDRIFVEVSVSISRPIQNIVGLVERFASLERFASRGCVVSRRAVQDSCVVGRRVWIF